MKNIYNNVKIVGSENYSGINISNSKTLNQPNEIEKDVFVNKEGDIVFADTKHKNIIPDYSSINNGLFYLDGDGKRCFRGELYWNREKKTGRLSFSFKASKHVDKYSFYERVIENQVDGYFFNKFSTGTGQRAGEFYSEIPKKAIELGMPVEGTGVFRYDFDYRLLDNEVIQFNLEGMKAYVLEGDTGEEAKVYDEGVIDIVPVRSDALNTRRVTIVAHTKNITNTIKSPLPVSKSYSFYPDLYEGQDLYYVGNIVDYIEGIGSPEYNVNKYFRVYDTTRGNIDGRSYDLIVPHIPFKVKTDLGTLYSIKQSEYSDEMQLTQFSQEDLSTTLTPDKYYIILYNGGGQDSSPRVKEITTSVIPGSLMREARFVPDGFISKEMTEKGVNGSILNVQFCNTDLGKLTGLGAKNVSNRNQYISEGLRYSEENRTNYVLGYNPPNVSVETNKKIKSYSGGGGI